MQRDHYLPATHLASFSLDMTLPRRERLLAVGDLERNRSFREKACNLAAKRGFYSVSSQTSDPRMVDQVWAGYEADLAEAVDELILGTITATSWTRVLVPFVAGILVRGPDFNTRFGDRFRGSGYVSSSDNTNQARILELQRMLAPILAARWIVLTAQGEGDIVTNDIGFVAYARANTKDLGISIPLDRRHALALVPQRIRQVVRARGGEWYPLIEHGLLDPGSHQELNGIIASSARRFIFGSDESAIRSLLDRKKALVRVPEPAELGFISGTLAIVHEFAWHRLVSALAKPPMSDEPANFDLDWKAVANGWTPPVIFPLNLPEFPSSLSRQGDTISLDLFDVRGFTV